MGGPLAARGKSHVAADPRVGRSRGRLFSRALRPTRGSAATVHGDRRLLPRAVRSCGTVRPLAATKESDHGSALRPF